ncbi:DUF1493 family protein [Salmonella enterica]
MVAKISAFTGRAIPVVGWIILASDVSQIAYRTVRDYNRIARGMLIASARAGRWLYD